MTLDNQSSIRKSLNPEVPLDPHGQLPAFIHSSAQERVMHIESSAAKLALECELLARSMNEEPSRPRYQADFANPNEAGFSLNVSPGIAFQVESYLKKNGVHFDHRKKTDPHFHISLKDMGHAELNALGLKLEAASEDIDKTIAAKIGVSKREILRNTIKAEAVTALLDEPALTRRLTAILPQDDSSRALEILQQALVNSQLMKTICETGENLNADERQPWTAKVAQAKTSPLGHASSAGSRNANEMQPPSNGAVR